MPPPVAGGRRSGAAWPLLLLLLVGLLAAGGWWYMQQGFLAAERYSAQRVQEAEARAGKLEEQIKALRDSQGQLQSRSSALEAKIAQSATQQEQLAGLYEEIAKARGEGALAEVEQSVMMANQHLELTGNVQAALLALQNAERRLGESEQSQASAARRSVAQDIERLKALPDVDLTGSAAKLDDVVNRVDTLPLLADGEGAVAPAAQAPAAQAPTAQASAPAQPAEPAPGAAAADPGQASASTDESPLWQRIYARVLDAGARGIDMVREEFHSLVTIRRIDKPDNLLLSPEQKQAARDNLKLLLLNARLNLLNRHEDLFRKDLARAIDGMQRLFDVEQQDVKTAIAALQSLQAQPLALNLPSLAESLGAVRAARAAVEKRS